jgi:hypothetical protein
MRPGRWKWRVLGWLLILTGVALMMRVSWGLAWSGLAVAIGINYFFRSFLEPGQEAAVFPASVLTVTGMAVLANLSGWLDFELWRVWPIFFCSIGVGLALSWGLKAGGWGTLAAGGAFLIVAGYGFASHSWYRYLRWLRSATDFWPAVLVLAGGYLLFDTWQRRRSGGKASPGDDQKSVEESQSNDGNRG